jgi:hypothetical protein
MARRTTPLAVLAAAVALGSPDRAARPEDVKDPATAVSFWAPDGWRPLAESRATFSVHRRIAPDGKAFCGCLAGRLPGGPEELLDVLEAYWREGAETFTRLRKVDEEGGGSLAIRVEYRILAGAQRLSAVARLASAGDLLAAVWAATEEGADASATEARERILRSLTFPEKGAARPDPVLPAAPDGPSDLMYDPRFREGGTFDVLAKGAEPLLRTHVDAFVDLFEAAHEVALTAEEERAFRDAVEASFPGWDADAKSRFLHRLIERSAVRAALGQRDAGAAKAALAAFAADVDARIQAAPTAAYHQPLRKAKARRAAVFSPGEPPVAVSAEDAFEDLVHFLVCVARNEDRALTDGQRKAVRAETQRVLDATGPAVRRVYARMHRLWLLVKARWDVALDSEKMRMRWAAIRAFRGFAASAPGAPPPPPVPADGDLAAYAEAAAQVAAAMQPFDAYTSAFQRPQQVLAAALEGLGRDPADLEGAFSIDTLPLR